MTKQNFKNSPNELKKHINKIITPNNIEIRTIKLTKITGDYKPGYIYSEIKTHKHGNPMRPIISDSYSHIPHIKNPQQYNSTIYPK